MSSLSSLLDLIFRHLIEVMAISWSLMVSIYEEGSSFGYLILSFLIVTYIFGFVSTIMNSLYIEKLLKKSNVDQNAKKQSNNKKKNRGQNGKPLKDVLDISFIDRSSGHEFEYILGIIFKDLGYDVEVTGQPNLNNNGYIKGDYGVDLILIDPRRKKKIVVQAKRWRKPVDARAIQQIYSGKDFYDADEAWVITNSVFTKQTKEMARKLGVRLMDRQRLKSLIEKWLNSRNSSKNLVDNNVKHSSKPVIQMT